MDTILTHHVLNSRALPMLVELLYNDHMLTVAKRTGLML